MKRTLSIGITCLLLVATLCSPIAVAEREHAAHTSQHNILYYLRLLALFLDPTGRLGDELGTTIYCYAYPNDASCHA